MLQTVAIGPNYVYYWIDSLVTVENKESTNSVSYKDSVTNKIN